MHHLLTCNLGQAYTKLPDNIKNQVSPVKISNFGIDKQGRTVPMDFGEIGLLPETFVAHTMSTHDGSLAPIASSLGLSNNSNASMTRIRWYFGVVSDPKLGRST